MSASSALIDLAIGQPSLSLLPLDALRTATEHWLSRGDPELLQYGADQGDTTYRHSLAGFLSRRDEICVVHNFGALLKSRAKDARGQRRNDRADRSHRCRTRSRFATGCKIPKRLDIASIMWQNGSMKTTVDIPDDELKDAMRFTRAKTKREAIVTAIVDYNRRRRMAELTKRAGTCTDMITVDELQHARRRE